MNSVIYHVQTLSIITLLEGALLGGIALGSLKMVIVKVNNTQLSDSKFTALQKNAVMNILEVLCLVYRTVKIPIPLSRGQFTSLVLIRSGNMCRMEKWEGRFFGTLTCTTN